MEDTLQDRIYKILWDKRIINIPNRISSPVQYVLLKNPSLEDRIRALHVRDMAYEECINLGVPSEKDVIKVLQEQDLWSPDSEQFLEEVDQKIEFIENEIKAQKFIVKKRKLQNAITLLKEQKATMSVFKNEQLSKSAEYMAHEAYVVALLPKVILNFDTNNLYWPNDELFLNDKSKYPHFVLFLMRQLIEENIYGTEKLREVARSYEWRLIWSLSKENLSDIFNCNVSDLNTNQKMLIFWSRLYDSVYDDPERPDESVIEDDDTLDEWLQNRSLKNTDSIKLNKGTDHKEQMVVLDGYYVNTCTCGVGDIKVKGHGERPVHDAGCPWGTWVQYTDEERQGMADQVYGKNNKTYRSIMNRQQTRIMEHGVLDENKVRLSQERKMLGMEEKVNKKF